jgi:streptomycin 6-kinase
VTGGDASASDILAGTVAKLHRPRAAAPPQTLVPLERHFASLFERASQHQLLGRSAATARACSAHRET